MKKMIYIIGILVVSIIVIGEFLVKQKNIQIKDESVIIACYETVLEENYSDELMEEFEIEVEEEIQVEIENENEVTIEEVKETIQVIEKEEVIVENKSENIVTNTSNLSNSSNSVQMEEVKKEETVVVDKVIVEEVQKEEVIQKEEIVEEQKNVEEFKINNNMINTIKSIIESNESYYMNEFGYDIQVDSSIISITSQFTYSSDRVINKISQKFGTIKIYAQDYYVNGEYVWTECYII